MSSIVLATGNPHKVNEIAPILHRAGFLTQPQTDFFQDEVAEDGLSFLENALKKARFASQRTGRPALADDSGLEVEALQGRPGIFSARYADAEAKPTDRDNLERLLDEMVQLPYPQRKARYSCAVVYVSHAQDPMPLVGIGHWHGEILMKPRTDHGIGYDDVFWVPELLKTVSEIPFELKNQISHRARAVQTVVHQLREAHR